MKRRTRTEAGANAGRTTTRRRSGTPAPIAHGLEGVVAAGTRLSHVDGERGELLLAGFPVEELAPHAAYEEVLFLLWHDRLPAAAERAALETELAARLSRSSRHQPLTAR